jgi:hypothetical protein
MSRLVAKQPPPRKEVRPSRFLAKGNGSGNLRKQSMELVIVLPLKLEEIVLKLKVIRFWNSLRSDGPKA